MTKFASCVTGTTALQRILGARGTQIIAADEILQQYFVDGDVQ